MEVCEVTEGSVEEGDEEGVGWDDVKGAELDVKEVRAARKEDVNYMEGRSIWTATPTNECWETLGKALVSIRWVDTLEAHGVRSRLVARDF